MALDLYTIFGGEELFEHLRGEFSFVLFDETSNPGKLLPRELDMMLIHYFGQS